MNDELSTARQCRNQWDGEFNHLSAAVQAGRGHEGSRREGKGTFSIPPSSRRAGLRRACFYLLVFAFILHPSSFILSAPAEAKVKSVSGTVEYALPGETGFKPLKADQTLPMGTTVQTGKSGRAVIVTLPGAAIRMEGSSKVVLSELDFEKSGEKVTSRKAMIDLQSGTVSALISKNDPQTTDFRIKTPQGVAAARGTFYAVTVEGDKAHVAVKEGKVGIQKVEAAQAKAD